VTSRMKLELEGLVPRKPHLIAQFFSFTGNLFGARAAGKELAGLGWTDPKRIPKAC
jgi:hypothetical protein